MNGVYHHRRQPPGISMFAAEEALDSRKNAYCLCLHVRPTTIFIALFNMGSNMACGFLLMFIAMNDATKGSLQSSPYFQRVLGDPMRHGNDVRIFSGVSILMCFFFSLVAAMLLYGVIKAKPSYVLPFFCIQFIEYLHTILQFVGRMYTYPMASFYMNRSRSPYGMDSTGNNGDHVFDLNGHTLTTLPEDQARDYSSSLLFLTVLLIFRTFFLSVVWKCYRYLHLAEFILPVANIPYNDEPVIRSILIGGQAPPPKYEDAIKYPSVQPPTYDAAGYHHNPSSINAATSQPVILRDTAVDHSLTTTVLPAGNNNNSNNGGEGVANNNNINNATNIVTQDINNNPVVVYCPAPPPPPVDEQAEVNNNNSQIVNMQVKSP